MATALAAITVLGVSGQGSVSALTPPYAQTSAPGVLRQRPIKNARATAVAMIAILSVLGTHLFNFGFDGLHIGVLNADSDTSWSHVCVDLMLVVSAGVASLGIIRGRGSKVTWTSAAAILTFLAISEVSGLHAKIDSMSWGKLVYLPILLALCVCLWRLSRGSAWRRILLAGVATLVISFTIHVLGPHVVHALGWGTSSWAYQVKVALKEGTELAGWWLVAFGLCQLVFGHRMPNTPT